MDRTLWVKGRCRARGVAGVGALLIAWLAPSPAAAQTWAGGRTTPRLTEVVAIDKTGEPGWLYGPEDVAGDGLDNFKQQEQSIDVRTGYATTDAQRFWARVYVSDPNAVGGNVTVFVFIDADRSVMTGGTAAAPEIDARFTTDASPGGYDYVVGLRGNGSIASIWSWRPPQSMYGVDMVPVGQAAAEAGQDVDPIQINGAEHGYLQGMVDLSVLGLTAACEANLYIRSVNETAALGAGDLEVGTVAPCVPADGNGDGVPDLVVPPSGCTTDAECPGGGICEGGTCVLAVPCVTDADCAPDERCSPDGRCVPRPTGMCSATADCGDLVCSGGQCVACSLGGAECGPGRRCSPTGRCIDGAGPTGAGGGGGDLGLAPGDEVRGGACACVAAGARGAGGGAAALLLAGLALRLRRGARRASRRMQ